MPIRDILLFLILFLSLPFIFRRPYIGILVFAWFGYMNPHRLTWGPAYNFQFSLIVALTTIVATVVSSESKRVPPKAAVFVLSVFIIWCGITTQFALNPTGAIEEWSRFYRIQIMVFLCLILINSYKKLDQLIWIIVCSIGFYGVKGGLFTLRTGGAWMVLGPPSSFISGNTEIGFALVIIFPLMWYLINTATIRWVKIGMSVAFGLTVLAVFGTQSRGAFLAGGIMMIFLWLKNKHKIRNATVFLMLIIPLLAFMPSHYFERIETIQTFQEDGSAMGRINAWWFAYNLAKERPIAGGGFRTFTPELFQQYAPNPLDHHDAHSIYFEVLAEQGYVGLILFLILGFLTWRNASYSIKYSNDIPDLKSLNLLAKMVQVSLVAYCVGGAFLGLAYFDLPYHLVAASVIMRTLVEKETIAESKQPASEIKTIDA